MAEVLFLCPFDLERAAGTPLRAKTTIRAAATRWDCAAVATAPFAGVRTHVADGAWEIRPAPLTLRFRVDRFARTAWRAILAERPRVLYAFTALPFPAAWLARRRIPGVRRLVTEVHGVSEFEMREARSTTRAAFTLLERAAIRGSDHLVAMCHTQRDFLVGRYGASKRRTTVIWGPAELPPWNPPGDDGVLHVGYAGNARFWQGLDTVVAVCRSLSSHADIRFHFAGFERGALDFGACPNADVRGRVSDLELREMLAGCHVLLSTRRRDPVAACQYPHKLSTYLAAGRAVIATDVSDQRRIVEEAGCGRVIEAGSVGALRDAIEWARQLPAGERSRLGAHARAFAERRLDFRLLPDLLANVCARTV